MSEPHILPDRAQRFISGAGDLRKLSPQESVELSRRKAEEKAERIAARKARIATLKKSEKG